MQPCGSAEADARVYAVIKGLSDLMTKPQLVGLDFMDLRWLLESKDGSGGQAVCGQGIASGPDRAIRAAEVALADLEDQLAALQASEAGHLKRATSRNSACGYRGSSQR